MPISSIRKRPNKTFPKSANAIGYEKRQARKASANISAADVYEHIPERSRLDGENGDDEELASGDDEEIESDDAFEESDEERFAGLLSSKKSRHAIKQNVHFAKVNLNEDEEMYPHEDEDEDEETEEEDEDEQSDEEEEEEGEMGDELQDFVANLDVTAKKRKAPDEADGGDDEHKERRTPKRRLLQETTEAGEENEFHVRSSGAKLNLDDLLAPLAGQSSTLQSLMETTKILGSSKLKTLSTPLPQRAQDRLDREAAYEQTKEEVDKWSETMKRIREAEHLSFPLQAQSSGRLSNLELNAKFKPTTGLERSVDNLLKASKLREDDIYETEETMLKMDRLSVEEIAQRRNELRQMRELAFRAEIKARRVKKIKSKTYRRLKRKERVRLGENREDADEGRRGDRLRRRIQGVVSDQSDQESNEDEAVEVSDVEESIAKINHGASSEEDATKMPENDGVIAVRTGGRVLYRPAESLNVLSKTNSLGQPPSETSSVTLKSTDLLSPPPPSPPVSALLTVNPWLVRTGHPTGKVATTKNAVVVSKGSKTLDKAKHRLNKQASKTQDERAKALDEAALQISLDTFLRIPTTSTSKNVHQDEDDSGRESEVEAQENNLLTGKRKGNADRLAFQQRDLVALAFAGDNVVLSFEEAKRREIAADAPREVDTTIPGWGSWGGAGVKKAPPKPERIKVIPGIDPTTRADHGKKNIIISEKKDKKVAKYLVKDLPYPYTSKAQFERTMGVPLGAEWNTRVGFQRGTLPRIVKKPGVIIEPLQKLSS